MKSIVAAMVCALLPLLAQCAPLAAQATGETAAPDPFRFEGDSQIRLPAVAFAQDVAESPFVENHAAAQMRYAMILLARYHAPSTVVMLAGEHDKPGALASGSYNSPSAVDAAGRPLWFDAGGSDILVANLAQHLFNAEQFLDLERLVDDWSMPDARRANGSSLLSVYFTGMNSLFARSTDREAKLQIIRRWRELSPYSSAAAVTEAIYWRTYAWDARGNGYVQSVTEEGWRLFAQRLERARAALDDSKAFAAADPIWGVLSIMVGAEQNWPKSRLLREFAESAARHPAMLSLYNFTVGYLTPKWGGDWNLVDDFVRNAAESTNAGEGASMYARLYVAAECGCESVDGFRETLADWGQLKLSFDELMRRYPHSAFNANLYARYACMAGDKEAYLNQRFRIGQALIPSAWTTNRSADLCDHMFMPAPL